MLLAFRIAPLIERQVARTRARLIQVLLKARVAAIRCRAIASANCSALLFSGQVALEYK